MTDTEKVELEFYKNGSAQSVLKRFKFTKDEEKLIKDAIRTAKRDNPRMQLIYEVDILLKEVAKNREPMASINKTEVSAEALAKIELMKIKHIRKKEQLMQKSKNKISFFGFEISKSLMFFIIATIAAMGMQYYQNKKVDQIMEQTR